MINAREISEEVLHAEEDIVKVARHAIAFLKDKAAQNRRKRVRLCAHRDLEDALHEMLIVHTKDTYVRPHKHLHRCESFHVIEGVGDVVVFDEVGNIVKVVPLGDYGSERAFYYRLSQPYFHTLLIRSDVLVFHETTTGPFRRSDTVFAPWAPPEEDEDGRRAYMARLASAIEDFSVRAPGEGEPWRGRRRARESAR